ncbi:hypothetical protein [Allofournierella sp.]|uniref:hypothetical protein n=1 Tax=Allofournierella sp. TaxID=1940256 RepID=UPI003AB75993
MYEPELKEYCRKACRELQCGRTRRQKFRDFVAASARDYLEQRPEAAFAELEAALGQPEEAAREFMASLPEGTAQSWRRARSRRNAVLIGAAGALIAVLAGLVIWYYCVRGVYTKTVTITYYEMDESMTPEEMLAAMPTARPIED